MCITAGRKQQCNTTALCRYAAGCVHALPRLPRVHWGTPLYANLTAQLYTVKTTSPGGLAVRFLQCSHTQDPGL